LKHIFSLPLVVLLTIYDVKYNQHGKVAQNHTSLSCPYLPPFQMVPQHLSLWQGLLANCEEKNRMNV